MASLIHPHLPVHLAAAIVALFGWAVGYFTAWVNHRPRR